MKTFTIKITEDLIDLSGDNLEFFVPAGAIFENVQHEGAYFIVDTGNEQFPVMEDECEILEEK